MAYGKRIKLARRRASRRGIRRPRRRIGSRASGNRALPGMSAAASKGRKTPSSRTNLPRRAPTYVKGSDDTLFSVVAESTGMQIRKLGTFQMVGFKPNPIKTIGKYSYHNITPWIVQSSQGVQNVDYLDVILTRDIIVGTANTSRTSRLQLADDLYQLNPYTVDPTNNIHTGVTTGTARNDVMYIDSVRVVFEFLNMTILPQEMQLIMCTPNFDTSINPIDSWIQIVASKGLTQATATTAVDISTGTASAGGAVLAFPRESPFTHREFRKLWSALNKTKICLQAGEQVNIEMVFKYNRIIEKELFATSRTGQFLKGLTIFPMVITNAGLAGISSSEVLEATEISYGEVKVGVMTNQYYQLGALPATRKSFARVFPGFVQNVGLGATSEVQKIFGDDDTLKDAGVSL